MRCSNRADAEPIAALCARLVHDVGKHVSRTARNLPAGPLSEELRRLCVRDLFGREGEPGASKRFRELSAPLEQLANDERLEECRVLLGRIDALEAAIRLGDEAALRRAAEMAIDVDMLLRSLAREAGDACR
jgi:hypothetical protein